MRELRCRSVLQPPCEQAAAGTDHAFLRRLTVYGTSNSGNVFLRLTNTSITGDTAVIDGAEFRGSKIAPIRNT